MRAARKGRPRSHAARRTRQSRRSPPWARGRARGEWRGRRRRRPPGRGARPQAIAPRETQSRPRRVARSRPGGKKIVGDEAPHRRADPPLVLRDHGGMRDGQAERAAKERDDREPVGAGPDHAGFREGGEIGRPDPARRRAAQGDIDRRHQNEQQGGERAHPAKVAHALGLAPEGVGGSERRGFRGSRGGEKAQSLSRDPTPTAVGPARPFRHAKPGGAGESLQEWGTLPSRTGHLPPKRLNT